MTTVPDHGLPFTLIAADEELYFSTGERWDAEQ